MMQRVIQRESAKTGGAGHLPPVLMDERKRAGRGGKEGICVCVCVCVFVCERERE
jgi:hypothetical protein